MVWSWVGLYPAIENPKAEYLRISENIQNALLRAGGKATHSKYDVHMGGGVE